MMVRSNFATVIIFGIVFSPQIQLTEFSICKTRLAGLAIRVCHYDESNQLPVHSEEKIFYTEEDYRDFLARRGWTCLQVDGFRNIENMDDLQPGAVYRGVR